MSVRTQSAARARARVDANTFSMALAGDSLMTRTFSSYNEPRFRHIVDLVRGADAAFMNFEMLLHDFEPYPMNESGGTWMRGDPDVSRPWCETT